MVDVRTIKIDDTEYVRKCDVREVPKMSGEVVIIRAKEAGVFCGEIKKRDGENVVMKSCRRLWYWDGAASLSQMAINGVSKPQNCKFSVVTYNHEIIGVCEIIPCTEKAVTSIMGAPEWKQ